MLKVRRFGFVSAAAAVALLATLLTATPSTADPAGTADRALQRDAAAITASEHSCVIVETGDVKCWGQNFDGQLGQGDPDNRGDGIGPAVADTPAIDLGTGRTATAITAGETHTCALLDNGTIKCWGDNIDGQLGLGDTVDRGDEIGEMGDNLAAVDLGTDRTATAITTGTFHTCALLDNGTTKCWGANGQGQLGLGDTFSRGDDADEMGDNLAAVDLGTDRTATAITAGGDHTCALLDNNTTKCWGANSNGQLGLGDTDNRGDAPDEMGDNLAAVDLGTGRTATAITTGGWHTCALLDNNTTKCWGGNWDGQLGLGDTEDRGDDADEMGDNLAAVDLGTGRTATAITAGGSHTCALLDNGTIKCWGWNAFGQLGLGDTFRRGDDADEMGDNLAAVDLGTDRTATAITAGTHHTCALLDNNTTKCWGYNGNGRLGQGDTNHRGDAPGEMGDNLAAVDLGGSLLVTGALWVPSQPGMPVVVAGAEAVSLSWTAPVDDGGSVITSYVVQVSTDAVTWTDATTVDATAADIAGLEAGVLHYFRVIAVNATGESVPSLPNTATPTTTTTTTVAPVVTCPTSPDHGFSDVPASSFADDDITCIKALDITTGTSATTYSPANFVTREQMAAFIGRTWKALGNDCPTTPAHGFVDVAASSFAADDITCIKALDITTGTSATTYSPANFVTREQMAAFIARTWRAMGNDCPTTPAHGFVDVAASSFADDDITCIKALDITTGTSATTYSPANFVTREQMAAFIARLIRTNADLP